MDSIARELTDTEWTYGDKDPAALTILEDRISQAGRRLGLITYSELVEGVIFHLPNVRNGAAYEIQTYDWKGLDRAVVGSFLGHISARSYLRAGFMASALVVNKGEYRPSQHFFDFMEHLAILSNRNEGDALKFWAEQVNKAHKWYKRHYR